MREIKFRGMTITGKWVYGLLSISMRGSGVPEKGYYISNAYGMSWAYQIRPETLGQYTGLKDKNDRKIYEGDILQLDGVSGYENGYDFTPFLEIICNIHENPELMEDRKK